MPRGKIINKAKTEEEKEKDIKKKKSLLLEFLNRVLEENGLDKIEEIEGFKDVLRDNLVSDKSEKVVDEFGNRFIGMYGKTKLRFADRVRTKSYIRTMLRIIVEDMGYKWTSYDTFKTENRFNTHSTYYVISK